MLLQLKPICEQKRTKKDGTSLIYLQYCHNNSQKPLLNTGIRISPAHWNQKKLMIKEQLPAEYGDFRVLNDKLREQYRLAENLIMFARKRRMTNVCEFLTRAFHPDLDFETLLKDESKLESLGKTEIDKPNKDIYFQLADYIKCKEGKVAKSTVSIFSNLGRQLKCYEVHSNKKITFDSIDFDFFDRFSYFLMFDYIQERTLQKVKGLKQNSVRKAIVQLRRFVNDRQKRKIIPKSDPVEFNCPEEEADAIYLTTDEIQRIAEVDLSPFPYLKRYRSRFVVACLTALRFVDFSRLKREDIRNGYLYKKQEKSDKWVVIPLQPLAKKFIEEIFDEAHSSIANPDFNAQIKVIGKLAGISSLITFSFKKGSKTIEQTKAKCDWITSHTGRRSFCTNEFLAGTPVKLIMGISGHKKEKDFFRYIRITAEEAGMIVAKIWEERQSTSTR